MTTTPCPICDDVMAMRDGPVIRCGTCHGISMAERVTTAVYDEQYVADRYDKYTTTRDMSRLRMEVIGDTLRLYERSKPLRTILDVGYGNGDFIRTASACGWAAYGHDVNVTEYPGVTRVALPTEPHHPRYHVVTFFDSLEHFEDLTAVERVSRHADYIVVSFPTIPLGVVRWPRYKDNLNPLWKHYRPGEHHFHFTPLSLQYLFSNGGVTARPIYIGHPEDAIRGTLPNREPNITTMILKCT